MVNRIRLKVMRKKPTMNDLVQANPSKNARVVVHAAMDGARKEQNALLKKAAEL